MNDSRRGWPQRVIALGGRPAFTIAAVAFGLAVLARQFLRGHSYWYDESYLLLNVFARSHGGLLGSLDYCQVAPPGYLWLLRSLYEWFGVSECIMRLQAFLAAAGTILLFVPLARRVLGPELGGWAIATFAVCPHILTHGCEVKPYAIDVFFSTAIASSTVHRIGAEPRSRSAGIGLIACVVLCPWFSFPSVFSIAAACVALLTDGVAKRSRCDLLSAIALGSIAAMSALAMWAFAARHHGSALLNEYWAKFLMPSSILFETVVGWLNRCLNSAANYVTPDLGPLVATLVAIGTASMVRRRFSLSVMLAGPLMFGLLASALGKYPMGERLTFFAAPTLLLLAFHGIAVIAQRIPARFEFVVLAILMALPIPGMVREVPVLFAPARFAQFREAFAWMESRRQPNELLWVSHAEVYRVYYPKDENILNPLVPLSVVIEQARDRTVWIVTTRENGGLGEAFGAAEALRSCGLRETMRKSFCSVDVIQFKPSETP